MRYVWEVRVTGNPQREQVTASITDSMVQLCAGRASVDEITDDAWIDDVNAASVIDVALSADAMSVLVEIETHDDDEQDGDLVAAALSGGFDGYILDQLLGIDGVTEVSHSDRIGRAL